MYKKNASGWLKHIDFIVLDLLCMHVAFVLAYVLRNGMQSPYLNPLYRNMVIVNSLLCILVAIFNDSFSNVLKRGYYKEFTATVKHVCMVEVLVVLYLFTTQEGQLYSRMILYLTGILYAGISYFVRLLWKHLLCNKVSQSEVRSLLIVTTKDIVFQVLENLKAIPYGIFYLSGLVILDEDMTGKSLEGIPVVANMDTAAQYVCREWIDEVLVIPSDVCEYPKVLVDQLMKTGVTLHVNLSKVESTRGQKQFVEKLGKYTVFTSSLNVATPKQVFIKRAIDIVGGLVGCLITGVAYLVVAPIIWIQSPGPVFFSQERVGRNGKKFKMYKFRTMYLDAEERKKELMEQNRIKDGMMFKMDFDPRVIGNKVLEDGTQKTGIIEFMRKISVDEFPQFYNVLKGDMSLVGTRPPTLDEWEKYELHHRARLAAKPGITGMWQVSGRSNIMDFEEVVKLDTQYITEWSMGLDFKILLKTVKVVLKKEGAM